MPIATISSQNSPKSPKILFYLLTLVGIGLMIYFGKDVLDGINNLRGKSGLSVVVKNDTAEVFLNNNLVGTAPVELQTIKPGENKVTLTYGSKRYESSFNFLPNWHVVLIRDLGVSNVFSSGQNTWMEQTSDGSMLSVISEPSGASVYIDNTEIGKTPYSSNKLTEGDYDLKISLAGYEDETARIKIVKGHKLNVSAKLFPLPVPSRIELMEGSETLYKVATDNSLVFSNAEEWVKALIYWNQTRGINLSGSGVNKEKVFDYFIDYNGVAYSSDGAQLDVATQTEALSGSKKGAYLGRLSDGPGLTVQAKTTLEGAGSTISGKKATVKQTETGWLRVRETAGLGGVEISRVNSGEEFSVLEESTGWVKIKVSDTIQGWVSADYVDVK